jgi:hypothetical protein
MIGKYKLNHWKVEEVFTDDREVKTYNHLFVDKKTMGDRQWEVFKQKILTFFL